MPRLTALHSRVSGIFVALGDILERGGEAQSDRQHLTADERGWPGFAL